jgi:hypothetical protein
LNIQLSDIDKPQIQLKSIDSNSPSIELDWFAGTRHGQAHDDPDCSPFVRAALAFVRLVVQSVDEADFRVREHFQQAIWALGQLGVSEKELSDLLSTTPNAVNRWLNGRSAPTPVVRPIIVRAGLDILRRDGMKIAGRRFDPISGRPIESSAR